MKKMFTVSCLLFLAFMFKAYAQAEPEPEPGLIVDDQGNVGIGTETPEELLEVNGNAKVNADLLVDGVVTVEGMVTVNNDLVTTGTITAGTLTAGNIAPVPYGNGPVPPGTIIMWYGDISSPPEGWVPCDGRTINWNDVPFTVPDLRDRFIVGAGSSYGRGYTGGEATHTLTVEEMPSHNHGVYDPGHNHNNGQYNVLLKATNEYTVPYINHGDNEPDCVNYSTIQPATTGISIQSAGGNNAHENRPPYYALYFLMKL